MRRLVLGVCLTLVAACAAEKSGAPDEASKYLYVADAPVVSIEPRAAAVSSAEIMQVHSIAGSYFSHSGGSLDIAADGSAQIENMLGVASSRVRVQASSAGSVLNLGKNERVPLRRHLLGLIAGNEVLLRRDGAMMVQMPPDPRLIGNFVSSKGHVLVSSDGRVFDYLVQGGSWRRLVHGGNYALKGSAPNIDLVWLHAPLNPPSVDIMSDGIRVNGTAFLKTDKVPTEARLTGDFKDNSGNMVSLAPNGAVRMKVRFPGKVNEINASGYSRAANEKEVAIFSDDLGPSFLLTARRLGMGHMMVSLPDASGALPLILRAPPSGQIDTVEQGLLGFYVNEKAYDFEVDAANKLVLRLKSKESRPDDDKTAGAVERGLVGVELLPKGEAKFFYDQGPPVPALVDKTNDGLMFYFADYQDQPLYQVKEMEGIRVPLLFPENGFRREKVPTIRYGENELRHYKVAYTDIWAKAFEENERAKDLALAQKWKEDPSALLSDYEGQAERERRMRRRQDGRMGGNPAPDVGEFFVSRHEARVKEMEGLARELTSLPQPRNAKELRDNMAREKSIRERAARLHDEDQKERDAAP